MRTIRIGLLGCGVVGSGVLELLRDNASLIQTRLGGCLDVARIVARDGAKPRGLIVPRDRLGFDVAAVLEDPTIDIVVEVMGGIEPACSIVRRAIESGKHVVTANKALLAEHGNDLLELAEHRGVDLYFEASVAGGVPIIRVLREALASDRVLSLRGIVNGTSNYILTRMARASLDFDVALREAQAAGYAEADPTLDVSGGDAAHKLTILATLAFGAKLSPADVSVEGIDWIAAKDIHFAARFGYVIKPLAVAARVAGGALDLRVHPALVDARGVLASISGALNAIQVHGAALGPCLLSGAGAGSLPTAMSVVSDIVDVGRNLLVDAHGRVPSRSFHGEHLVTYPVRPIAQHRAQYYLRFCVHDRPGVLASIAGSLGSSGVSIEQMVQDGRDAAGDQPVSIVMLTHEAEERSVRAAVDEISGRGTLLEPVRVLRIEREDAKDVT